jgi:hypothetical protein
MWQTSWFVSEQMEWQFFKASKMVSPQNWSRTMLHSWMVCIVWHTKQTWLFKLWIVWIWWEKSKVYLHLCIITLYK